MSKKTLSIDELKKLAADLFKNYPEEAQVFATSDGNIFFEKNKNAAELHAKTEKLKVYTITNPEYKAPAIDEDEEEVDPFEDEKTKKAAAKAAKKAEEKAKKEAEEKEKQEAAKKEAEEKEKQEAAKKEAEDAANADNKKN